MRQSWTKACVALACRLRGGADDREGLFFLRRGIDGADGGVG